MGWEREGKRKTERECDKRAHLVSTYPRKSNLFLGSITTAPSTALVAYLGETRSCRAVVKPERITNSSVSVTIALFVCIAGK